MTKVAQNARKMATKSSKNEMLIFELHSASDDDDDDDDDDDYYY